MNTINGHPYSYFGFEIIKIDGVLDMPSRLGDITYDWGDFIEPLVEEEDIFWKSRDIKVDVFFNGERYDMTLKQAIERLESLPNEFVLNTYFGGFTVNLKQAIKSRNFTSKYAKIRLDFVENAPQFTSSNIGVAIGGNGIKIDGFDLFNDFGIIVTNIKRSDNIPLLKSLEITTFNSSKPYSEYRNWKGIELSCVKIYESKDELRETTEKFKKLLSQSGFRELIFDNQTFKCFISEGFKIQFRGSNTIRFKLVLNTEEIPESILFEAGLFETGLFE